ncbi:hypothetical protein TRFO_30704 [Tritrichomonas foetus]|uniref:RING-type domain-containing protein n=1 Tax=Tritrichomonas foetus TaxID=1144522 RepID=A0A1J4JUX3_9EUKA|nr:hypothetical protein TRFO_30704 [Tritrichomonas foetus]|eukprot:OHT02240.1 hypothetical protein TRFO_30704 [Tritrichomonas foetus]
MESPYPILPNLLLKCIDYNATENRYDFHPETKINHVIYIRTPISLKGTASIDKVITSNCELRFNDSKLDTSIQVTANGKITAYNCVFSASKSCKYAIEIFGKSEGYFKNCVFIGFDIAAVLVRDNSYSKFEDCTFIDSLAASISLCSNASADMIRCKFNGSLKYGVFCSGSFATIVDCEFKNLKERAIFVYDDSSIVIKDSTFEDCKNGICVAKKSIIQLDNSSFDLINLIAISVIENSYFTLKNSRFNDIGMALNVKNSNGEFRDSNIHNTHQTPIALFGKGNSSLISNVSIDTSLVFGIIIRDKASPQIFNCSFENIYDHCFSISDFSSPLIAYCYISSHQNGFSIFNGATPLILYNEIKAKTAFSCLTLGCPIIAMNNCSLCMINTPNNLIDLEFIDYTQYKDENGKEKIIFDSLETLKHYKNYGKNEFMKELKSDKKDEIFLSFEGDIYRLIFQQNGRLQYIPPLNDECECKCCLKHIKKFENECNKCVNCGKKSNILCSPCAHKIYCEECVQQKKVADKCPLCHIKIVATTPIYENFEECAICYDAKPDVVFLLCGHKCCCHECAEQTLTINKKCPVCNSKLSAIRHIFPI